MVQSQAFHAVLEEDVEYFRSQESLKAVMFGIGAPYCCAHIEAHDHDLRPEECQNSSGYIPTNTMDDDRSDGAMHAPQYPWRLNVDSPPPSDDSPFGT